ncbi:MAG: NADH:flavin oxidoreductase [Spirochaetaceae bacterium]|jgi:2,4-dienoyl-CoA reductase-like NADH-dependent reductase (Old Yellow Enzyme family)|nr:NADH:flavin oxidoreductase [Spirochaetaceae bacterium]
MKTLFDKTQLGQMVLKNRFVRAAIGEKTQDGQVNETILSLYKELALGGTGTLITGFTLVDEAEKNFPLMAFYNDSFHEGHRALTGVAHENGANIILQLVYVGSYAMGETTGMTILAPSTVENLNTKIVPQEITVKQIKAIQEKFADVALRAKNAGYDGIEIHAAHGFLLSQFMTPYYNRRTDLYGGSVENRARMSLETYAAIRESAGTDFPVLIKINVNDGFENGVAFEDVLYLCETLTKRNIDAIEISGAFAAFPQDSTSYFKKEAEQIAAKNATGTKIIMTGGNRDFDEMTGILNSTKIEYFGMARPLMKEPDLINTFTRKL